MDQRRQPQSGVVGWVNTKLFLETGDSAKSQGWTPIIVDTNGNGKRDAWVGPNDPLDPTKDKRIMAAFYGVMPSPVDDSIWGQAMDVGFSRRGPARLRHPARAGSEPVRNRARRNLSAAGRRIRLARPRHGPERRRLDRRSRAGTWRASTAGSARGRSTGPTAATGKHCPEGWTLYRMPGPQFKGLDPSGSANHAYYIWVDRYNTLGLGANVPIASTNGGESLLAVVDGKLVDIRVPYPLGFFTKLVDGRIDDPNAGWKGRALWTMSGTRTVFHNEGGTQNRPKVYKVQVRPDPLAQ